MFLKINQFNIKTIDQNKLHLIKVWLLILLLKVYNYQNQRIFIIKLTERPPC